MSLDNLVKVTIVLSDRRYAAGRTPALTVIITGMFDEGWVQEIEAVAPA